jgi:hypothetical protein
MTKVSNISDGPRGIWSTSGLVMIDKGKSADVELAKGEEAGEWFQFDGKAAEPGPLDRSIPDLTAHLATMDDADEVQKLLDAETAGKSRAGAIAALEARRDELLA